MKIHGNLNRNKEGLTYVNPSLLLCVSCEKPYMVMVEKLRFHRFRVNHLDSSGEVPMEIVRDFIGISIHNSFSVRK